MWLFVDFCVLPWISPNLPELNLKLFWTSEQNNFRFSSGKFGGKHRNQQKITCQVLAELNRIRSCLIFIKLYILLSQIFRSSAGSVSQYSSDIVQSVSYLLYKFHKVASFVSVKLTTYWLGYQSKGFMSDKTNPNPLWSYIWIFFARIKQVFGWGTKVYVQNQSEPSDGI